jgi:hypothetical protein
LKADIGLPVRLGQHDNGHEHDHRPEHGTEVKVTAGLRRRRSPNAIGLLLDEAPQSSRGASWGENENALKNPHADRNPTLSPCGNGRRAECLLIRITEVKNSCSLP